MNELIGMLGDNWEVLTVVAGSLGASSATLSKRLGGSRAKTLKRIILLAEKAFGALGNWVRTDPVFGRIEVEKETVEPDKSPGVKNP